MVGTADAATEEKPMSDRSELIHAPVSSNGAVSPSRFLRSALLADAAASAASGLLMFAGASVLDRTLGLPAALLFYAGLVLLPYAALVGYMGTRAALPRWAVWVVIIGNAAWAAESVLLLLSGWVQPTGLGYAFVLAQAAVVALFAELQYVGLGRSSRA
jgi:hypothetical protein